MDLKTKAISGTLWNVVMIFTVSGMDLLVFTVLARTLPISEFALLTFCFMVIEFANIFVSAGINQNLIQRSVWDDKFFHSVYTFILFMGLSISIIISGVGGLVAYSFYSELAAELIFFLGILPLIFGLQSSFSAKLERDFRNKELTKIKSASSFISGALIITLVAFDFGIWAAVIGKVLQNILVLLLIYIRANIAVRLVFDKQHLSEIRSFCLPLFGMAFINFFHSKGSVLLVGGVLGAERFAFLSVANRAYDTLGRLTISTVNTMVVPTLSRLEGQKKIQGFYQILSLTATFIAPCFIGLAAVADPLVQIIFGDTYAASAFLLQILCAAIVPSLAAWYLPNLLISIGATSMALKLKIYSITRSLGVALIFVWFGIELMVVMQTIVTFIVVPFQVRLAKKVVNLDIKTLIAQVLPATVSSILMFVSISLAKLVLPGSLNELATLVILIFIGISAYAFFILTFFSKSVSNVLHVFKTFRGNTKKKH